MPTTRAPPAALLGGCATLLVVASWWRLFPGLAARRTFEETDRA